jgi:hypothetical protein
MQSKLGTPSWPLFLAAALCTKFVQDAAVRLIDSPLVSTLPAAGRNSRRAGALWAASCAREMR